MICPICGKKEITPSDASLGLLVVIGEISNSTNIIPDFTDGCVCGRLGITIPLRDGRNLLLRSEDIGYTIQCVGKMKWLYRIKTYLSAFFKRNEDEIKLIEVSALKMQVKK